MKKEKEEIKKQKRIDPLEEFRKHLFLQDDAVKYFQNEPFFSNNFDEIMEKNKLEDIIGVTHNFKVVFNNKLDSMRKRIHSQNKNSKI